LNAGCFQAKRWGSGTARGKNGHQHSVYVNYSMPMQFAAPWIALEDVKEGAGELFYHVGSHRIGQYRFHGRCKGVSEARRLVFSETHTGAQIAQHADRIAKQVKGLNLRAERFLARLGDVLAGAADLVQVSSTISKSKGSKKAS
jgi:phytanoyl-CoA hydroxylase